MASTSDLAVSRIEFRTFDEILCDANYFYCSKVDVLDSFEAFIKLYNHQMHFNEGWGFDNESIEDRAYILKHHILLELDCVNFNEITGDTVLSETSRITSPIFNLLDNMDASKQKRSPDRWGIYLNNELKTNNAEFVLPFSQKIVRAVALNLEWNEVEIFYETDNEFIYYWWGTGI
jgi:hypothetical protein